MGSSTHHAKPVEADDVPDTSRSPISDFAPSENGPTSMVREALGTMSEPLPQPPQLPRIGRAREPMATLPELDSANAEDELRDTIPAPPWLGDETGP